MKVVADQSSVLSVETVFPTPVFPCSTRIEML